MNELKINPSVIFNQNLRLKINKLTFNCCKFYGFDYDKYNIEQQTKSAVPLLFFDLDSTGYKSPMHSGNGYIKLFSKALQDEIDFFEIKAPYCVGLHILQRCFIKIHKIASYRTKDYNDLLMTINNPTITRFLNEDLYKRINKEILELRKEWFVQYNSHFTNITNI